MSSVCPGLGCRSRRGEHEVEVKEAGTREPCGGGAPHVKPAWSRQGPTLTTVAVPFSRDSAPVSALAARQTNGTLLNPLDEKVAAVLDSEP